MNDLDLLGEFARNQSQDAFTALVQRHLNLVYCAALRQVRSPQLAEEIAQSVFTDLARNADRLRPNTILTAWLYAVTRRTAINVVRGEARRQAREQIGLEMTAMNATDDDWRRIEPLLDEAMDKLGDAERSAILLRYFENKSLREVGKALGTTDDTARKRVNHAVVQLRTFFEKSGVPIGTSGLIAVISGNAVQAAPAALFLTISTTAAALGGITIPAVATIGATASKAIAMSIKQNVLVGALVAAAFGTSIYEARQVSEAHANVSTLQKQQAELNEQIARLTRERDEATRRIAVLAPTPIRPTSEVLKLRGEVGRLTAALNANDPNQAAAQSWLGRVNELKQYLAQHPEAGIPELQYVTEDDWLRVTMSAFAGNTNGLTDERYRLALVSLRNMGKGKFARLAATALKSYGLTHDGQFPKDLSELTPHFTEPIDSAILERYGIFPSSTFKGTRATGESVIAELASPDEDLNYRYVIHADGNDAVRFRQPASVEKQARMDAEIKPLLETLGPVAMAYAAAHEGRPPPDAGQMAPYATTPEQQSALQKLIEIQKEAATGVSATRDFVPQPNTPN